MAAASSTKDYLQQYVTERLPALVQGGFESPNDPPAIAEDQRYTPLKRLDYEV